MDIRQALTRSRPFYVNVYRFGPRLDDDKPGAYFGVAHHYRDAVEIAAQHESSKARGLLYRLRVTPKRTG